MGRIIEMPRQRRLSCLPLAFSLMSNYNEPMKTDHIVQLISSIRGKAYKFIIEELRANQVHGIAPSHGGILSALYEEGKLPMRSLAERIGRDKSTVTTLVDKLVRLGYVRKAKGEEDRRVTYIVLTKKGRILEPVFKKISRKLIRKVYKGVSEEEKRVLIEILERLQGN